MPDAMPVLAIVVLYGMTADESPAFRSLRHLLEAGAAEFEVMVFDNTPYEQPRPNAFSGIYQHDAANPGLATAYNFALRRARQRGLQWLLLLDQDTTVTSAYLLEIGAELGGLQPGICALVPQLMRGSSILSPLIPPFSPAGEIGHGVSARALHYFNSGALLRVSALEGVGGFPQDFPLDYLDHATFHLLQASGGQVHVLQAQLAHSLSQDEAAADHDAQARRHAGILRAAARFYRRFGSTVERRSFRRDLLRKALVALRNASFARAGRLLTVALRDC